MNLKLVKGESKQLKWKVRVKLLDSLLWEGTVVTIAEVGGAVKRNPRQRVWCPA